MFGTQFRNLRASTTLPFKPPGFSKPLNETRRTTVHTLSNEKKVDLVIIGACGAVGLPASYLASARNLKIAMIDSGLGAIDSSTHTVHTSIVRPNYAVWPFSKAVDSWLHNGPFDMRLSRAIVPFGVHSMLQSYCVSQSHVHRMWSAFRTLAVESRQIYMSFDKEFGPITLGEAGRGHVSSPLVAHDKEVVMGLSQKLENFGVQSRVFTSHDEIQRYVGRLRLRHPELMVSYPEDFVLDLQRYKAQLLDKVTGIRLHDTVIGLEQDSGGSVTTVITAQGRRIETDAVLYAGGWRANKFLKECLGININGHLNVATGVRFELPNHLVDRSIVCGPMFLAPGYDTFGNPVTDIGQMFLVNITDPYPSTKHLTQALKRFHTYFDYQGDITRIWNCVGRPITTTGLPILERVAPNMVVALGPGMFGITVGASLAQRGLEMLLDHRCHIDQTFFERKSAWNIAHSFFQEKLSQRKPRVEAHEPQQLSGGPRVIQLGRRGAMTGVLHQRLAQSLDCAVYGAREIDAVIQDIQAHPNAVLLVASHGSQAKLPANYGQDYLSANQAIKKVLAQPECKNLSGIVVISGGIPNSVMRELMLLANDRKVRFVHLPGLATSMEVHLNAVQSLLPGIPKPQMIVIEDTFHRGKKEVPSAGGSQLLANMATHFGQDELLILTNDPDSHTHLRTQFPDTIVKIARTDDEIQRSSDEFPDLIPVVSRSYRIDTPYRYQHRLTIQDDEFTLTFEQSVTNRAQLVLAVSQVIQRLASLPPNFSGTGVGSAIPVITFKPQNSLAEGLRGIVQGLKKSGAILDIQSQHAEPGGMSRKLLTDPSGQITHFQHTPSLSCTLHIMANIDDQHFSIGLSELSPSRSGASRLRSW